MELIQINIKDLKFAEYNPRTISKEEFEGLKTSLNKYGQIENIIVNKDMTIISGHQRTRAWESLGNKNIMGYILDLDKQEEKKLNVLMNSQAISGSYDEIKLSEILEEIKLDEDYVELRLDKLESLDLSEESDEKGLNDLGNESQLVFKYSHKEYLNILDLLNNAKEKLECDTNEETLSKLLSQYK
jgi:hypothetical protein